MSNYRLNIDFSKGEDLDVIYKAGEKVILVKHTEGNADSQIAWVTFSPMKHNTVSWETDYAVYASTSEIQNGAQINMMSDTKATPKVMYNFEDGYFKNPVSSSMIGDNTYAINNNYKEQQLLTFGLAQGVSVNHKAFPNKPINAILVPFGQSAQMRPIEKIDVYLMRNIETSTVVSKIFTPVFTVTYDDETERTIEFNAQTGFFQI